MTLTVTLQNASYDVVIKTGLLEELGKILKEQLPLLSSQCAVITDTHVAPLYAKSILKKLKETDYSPTLFTIPAGEKSKSFEQAYSLCRKMTQKGLDRHSFIIALGGGVVGDLAGFVAAIHYRGIPVIQIPTTIVSQVDSSIGGKTGINLPEGKNLLGVFHQPSLVLIDPHTLQSLPQRQFNAGFAEVIKHAAIYDHSLFPLIENAKNDPVTLSPLIHRNIEIKADIVAQDPHETKGIRALLNFGHTIGHAIESVGNYKEYLHGEAIALGIRAACFISEKKSTLSQKDTTYITELLRHFDLPTELSKKFSTKTLIKHIAKDKKFIEGNIRFVLLEKLGKAFLSNDVTLEDIEHAIISLYN